MSLDRAINQFDLVSYVRRYNPTPTQPGEVTMRCPRCGKDDKLVINTTKKTWHCWICERYEMRGGRKIPIEGAGGVVSLIQVLEGLPKHAAIQVLEAGQRFEPVHLDFLEDFSPRPGKAPQLQATEIPLPEGSRAIHGILPYCRKRGIMTEDVRDFGLWYCDSGRFANRLIFPVFENRRLVYFQGRAMWGPQPGEEHFLKSLNPPKTPGAAVSSEVLFNLDVARQYPRVAIVEGPIDAIHAGSSAVATFGKKISITQIMKLKYAGVREVDLMWDGPSETEPRGAWEEMGRYAGMLAGLFRLRLVYLPRGDPGDYPREHLDGYRDAARPYQGSIARL